jgi:crossover junction endodeoxyribonuclease RuvC
MKDTILGCDPGQSGAIAAIRDGKVVALHDMPTMARLHGKGQQVDPYALSSIMLGISPPRRVLYLEAVSAMPGQGVSSTFRFGESLGVVLGVAGALQIPVVWITPAVWKKRAGLTGKDKDASRTLCIQRHPEIADMLERKKDNGRADAICIAEFGEMK